MKPTAFLLATLAATGLATAPLAAQQPSAEPSPQQIEAATRYALPHLFQGFRAVCDKTLAADGYVRTQGDRLETKFAQGSDASWPQAKAALLQMAAKEGGEDGEALGMFAQLPDENLKPFVDGIIFSLVASELETDRCGDVERGLALLDPMPAENIAGLMGFLMEMVSREESKEAAPSVGKSRARP